LLVTEGKDIAGRGHGLKGTSTDTEHGTLRLADKASRRLVTEKSDIAKTRQGNLAIRHHKVLTGLIGLSEEFRELLEAYGHNLLLSVVGLLNLQAARAETK
jgi:hypothetical protein